MSGVSANCYATKWHHRRGSNRNDVDDLAKQRDLIRLCLNDREGDLAHIPCLIRLCPNGHAVALVRSLEHVHRLVGFYPAYCIIPFFRNLLYLQQIYYCATVAPANSLTS